MTEALVAREAEAVRPRPGTRVLVADDDDDMRDMILTTLRGDGYEVEGARDGLDVLLRVAASALGGHSYAAIVSDLRMPVMGGFDTCKRLREAGIETPILVMTAFSDGVVRERLHDLQVQVLEKPFDLDDLRAAVMHVTHAGR